MGGRGVNLYDLLVSRAGVRVPSEEEVRARKRASHVAVLAESGARPGVAEWIADARRLGLKVAIASSADAEWIDEHLGRVGLAAAFDCICCWDGATRPKPAPDLYLNACERIGVEPRHALAVEDSPNGIVAAQRAGLACIAVTHDLTLEIALAAEVVVGSLADLTLEAAIEQLAGAGSRP